VKGDRAGRGGIVGGHGARLGGRLRFASGSMWGGPRADPLGGPPGPASGPADAPVGPSRIGVIRLLWREKPAGGPAADQGIGFEITRGSDHAGRMSPVLVDVWLKTSQEGAFRVTQPTGPAPAPSARACKGRGQESDFRPAAPKSELCTSRASSKQNWAARCSSGLVWAFIKKGESTYGADHASEWALLEAYPRVS